MFLAAFALEQRGPVGASSAESAEDVQVTGVVNFADHLLKTCTDAEFGALMDAISKSAPPDIQDDFFHERR